jgi:phage FluMu protein Com
MAATTVTCPSCNATLKPKTPVAAGTRIKCPKCTTVFAVPADADDAPVPKPVAPRPAAPRPKPAARREEPDDLEEITEDIDDEPLDDEEEEERPIKRKKKKLKKKGVPLWVWLTAGGGLFLFLCCAGCGGYIWYIGSSVVNAGSGSITFLNYTKIQKGASEAQVKAILGEPRPQLGNPGNLKVLIWMDDKYNTITVTFTADKVTGRSCHLLTSSGLEVNQSGFAGQ